MCPRIILHVDLDAFYAAVEEREHPEYRGKPVVVGADPKEGRGRGVVATCNYEARRFGIHSAMPISQAWKLCKDAAYLAINHRLYETVSDKIMAVLKSYADKFEQVSIDEAFLDVSKRVSNLIQARELAKTIKKEILLKEGLTCSIGIAPNKLAAKIASNFHKPDGLTMVAEKDVKTFLAPLPVEKLWGIGKKTKNRLNAMGVRTIGDLASSNPEKLRDEFGSVGREFHQMAQGIDRSEIVEEWTPKSFSREQTFQQDISDETLIYQTVDHLSEEVLKDVEDRSYSFKTVTMKIRYQDFETHTHSKTLPFPVGKLETIKETARRLVSPFLHSEKKIRLVGVKASNLVQRGRQKLLE